MIAEIHPKLELALEALRQGDLVIYPTETFYGIAADIHSPAALDRLSALKQRDPASPFGLIAGDIAAAFALAREVPQLARRFAMQFWPGPLTIVLPARFGLHESLAGRSGVGVRVSSHPIARALANGLGRPITATSANLKGRPPVSVAAELDPALLAEVKVVLQSLKTLPGEHASTVISFAQDRFEIIREGAITVAALAACAQAGVQ